MGTRSILPQATEICQTVEKSQTTSSAYNKLKYTIQEGVAIGFRDPASLRLRSTHGPGFGLCQMPQPL